MGGKYIAIANDFDILYYNYKAYLLDCLSSFRFPLWSPAEAAGFPFYASPFTAAFYPLNIPLAVFYKFAGGYSRFDHQFFTILGISIFSLGMFLWLKQFKFNTRAVIFATLVASVSFKLAEIVRFPNAVHTAAWYPWILLLITRILIARSGKSRIFSAFYLVFVGICFLTAGYPYYVYYSLFLFPPYTLICILIFNRINPFKSDVSVRSRSVLILSVSSVFTISICAPYLYKMSQLLGETTDRGGGSFGYSTAHGFNLMDTVGSLIFPPAAQAEGWYYFGIAGFLIAMIYFLQDILGISFTKSVLRQEEDIAWYNRKRFRFSILLWVALITYITYGSRSDLFRFLWHHMPGFSSLRVWGRMNIILVPIIGIVLAASYSYFENLVLDASRRKAFFALHCCLAFILLLFQYNSIYFITSLMIITGSHTSLMLQQRMFFSLSLG
ncbi:hypothetical protein HC928_12855 [bacterium]|nr:hypothetical protein [bacterium]